MMKTVNRKAGYLILIVGLVACSAKSVKNSEEKDTDSVSIEVPSFDTDSAYAYIERQVQFGFRVPNTPAHLATADYLSSELARHGAVVEVQQGTVTAYDGTELSIRNIIGSFSLEKKNRILLFSHWDSRPYADNDPDKSKHRQPIAGADDGASGVGVLLEIARQIGKRQPDTGVDIAFFDAEDYGVPYWSESSDENTWALGTQYWTRRPHKPGYRPIRDLTRYGGRSRGTISTRVIFEVLCFRNCGASMGYGEAIGVRKLFYRGGRRICYR